MVVLGVAPSIDQRTSMRRLDAGEIRLRADVSIGIRLSGGIDSAIIAGMAAHIAEGQGWKHRLNCYTIGFEEGTEFDETGEHCSFSSTNPPSKDEFSCLSRTWNIATRCVVMVLSWAWHLIGVLHGTDQVDRVNIGEESCFTQRPYNCPMVRPMGNSPRMRYTEIQHKRRESSKLMTINS